jgi:hypothetical protein
MEISPEGFLYNLAVMMVTFAGFSALLLGIRQAAGARLTVLDRYLARTVLTNLFVLTAGALLPPVLALYGLPREWLWRISAILFGVPMLAVLVTYPDRRRKIVGGAMPRAVFAVLVVLGGAAILAMLVDVLADSRTAPAAYITALAVNFFTLAFAFITALEVVMRQPVEPPDGG